MFNEEGRVTKLRGALVAAVAALLLGNAVALAAYDGNGDGVPGPTREPVATAGAETPPAGTGAASSAPQPSVESQSSAPPPVGDQGRKVSKEAATSTTSSTWPNGGDYRYEVTVNPMCVMAGAPFTVTMRLRPGNSAVLIVRYADGPSHGTKHFGYAGDDGLFTYTGPAAGAPGRAILLTRATDETGRWGSTWVDFTVASATQPC